MNPILNFYLGGPDNKGRYLKDIRKWSDEYLEGVHDYIQWVFPTTEKSQFNLVAPVLDEETIQIWREYIELKDKLLESVKIYIGFLERNPALWIVPFNHNHLRITRMLKSMMCLGLEDEAKNIYNILENICINTNIDNSSLDHWREAVEISQNYAPLRDS